MVCNVVMQLSCIDEFENAKMIRRQKQENIYQIPYVLFFRQVFFVKQLYNCMFQYDSLKSILN